MPFLSGLLSEPAARIRIFKWIVAIPMSAKRSSSAPPSARNGDTKGSSATARPMEPESRALPKARALRPMV
jgi:hypothetical protein